MKYPNLCSEMWKYYNSVKDKGGCKLKDFTVLKNIISKRALKIYGEYNFLYVIKDSEFFEVCFFL